MTVAAPDFDAIICLKAGVAKTKRSIKVTLDAHDISMDTAPGAKFCPRTPSIRRPMLETMRQQAAEAYAGRQTFHMPTPFEDHAC
eukprot:CAMPEP_0183348702 /NCGR_PEP_ID=MMETSP0164_2-20130417/13129_1 /TAXON_ID=221442 /ORGANISM="Coccolithus pelagicus ssp braarudi, Strain PLY182g" /LENGTH=84 /DNA_ID=CAMNT_0025520331 /DNA_START=489 /DNA_END=740 /DNA_ORIENTATION=+